MDDESTLLKLASRVLTAAGVDVVTALNGEAALEAFRQAREAGSKFDLVVLDLHVAAGMDGHTTLLELRKLGAEMEVIACSGSSDTQLKIQRGEVAFDGFLPKPYHIQELRTFVLERINSTRR